MTDDGTISVSCDDNELHNLKYLCDETFGGENYIDRITVIVKTEGRRYGHFAKTHENALVYARDVSCAKLNEILVEGKGFLYSDSRGGFNLQGLRNRNVHAFNSANRPNLRYPFFVNEISKNQSDLYEVSATPVDGWIRVDAATVDGKESVWRWGKEKAQREKEDLCATRGADGQYRIFQKVRKISEAPKTVWFDKEFTSIFGTKELASLIPNTSFVFPKPSALIRRFFEIQSCEDSLVLDYFAGSGTTAHAVIDLNRQDGGHRKYILIEMGDHFDTVLKPRIEKVVYSPDWKDGKPETSVKGISHCFKYLRLESYEDALNNLVVDGEKGAAFAGVKDYFLKYMLDVETKGSPSLLRMGEVANPFGMALTVKKPASEEREERIVDLVETFNYLIGLRVKNTAAIRSYTAEFERVADEELPSDGHTKLTIKGAIKLNAEGAWKFRTVEGWIPKNRFTPNDGARERVLIVWRTLTDDREKDNAVLDYYLQHKEGVNPLSGEYDVIYVNGSNNVPNLKQEGDTWKVRSIEEDFQARMWEGC